MKKMIPPKRKGNKMSSDNNDKYEKYSGPAKNWKMIKEELINMLCEYKDCHPSYLLKASLAEKTEFASKIIDSLFDNKGNLFLAEDLSFKHTYLQAISGKPPFISKLLPGFFIGFSTKEEANQIAKRLGFTLKLRTVPIFRITDPVVNIYYYKYWIVDCKLHFDNFDDKKNLFEEIRNRASLITDYNLGLRYFFGDGVKVDVDKEKGIKYLTSAADKGHMFAQYYLGLIYFTGDGCEKDHKAAGTLLTLASNSGHPEAQYNLSIMYARGLGVEKNPIEAIKWALLSAKSGYVNAQSFLGTLYYCALDDKINAFMWLYKAIENSEKNKFSIDLFNKLSG